MPLCRSLGLLPGRPPMCTSPPLWTGVLGGTPFKEKPPRGGGTRSARPALTICVFFDGRCGWRASRMRHAHRPLAPRAWGGPAPAGNAERRRPAQRRRPRGGGPRRRPTPPQTPRPRPPLRNRNNISQSHQLNFRGHEEATAQHRGVYINGAGLY